ncbi:hypothetical protein [Mycolicibacterium sp. PDY-3]|uniref:hypothetical protein n=1 Tax=Mycolicibacterium sp. PDY-3 TaxID=3376069 RepID=UPI00379435B6
MQQSYTPNINVKAYSGMCQQYIDDAGSAPSRSPTAKAAFEKEQSAGRIRADQFPENVWVVAWFSFSKGSYRYPNGTVIQYKDAWHVAFVKRNGNSLEIHDSEVHSGARKPYTALAAVEAWFATYGAKYAGWSTDCDGRKYVTEDKKMVNGDTGKYIYRAVLRREPENDWVWKQWDGMDFSAAIMQAANTAEWQAQNHLMLTLYPTVVKENEDLKKEIEDLKKQSSKPGEKPKLPLDVVIDGDKYVKEIK